MRMLELDHVAARVGAGVLARVCFSAFTILPAPLLKGLGHHQGSWKNAELCKTLIRINSNFAGFKTT